MEKQLREKKIHAAILCNPHNPCGRVWERWELEKAMELYRKYDVYVISDEIWSDLILNGHKHIPSQSVSEDAASVQRPSTLHPKPLIWQDLLAAITLYTTAGGGIVF